MGSPVVHTADGVYTAGTVGCALPVHSTKAVSPTLSFSLAEDIAVPWCVTTVLLVSKIYIIIFLSLHSEVVLAEEDISR